MHIKLTNGVPEKYTIGQLRRDNPQVSFPKSIPDATLAGYGVYPLTTTNSPQVNYTKNIVEGTPDFVEGVWVQSWDIVEATPEEISSRISKQEAFIRSKRDSLISDTDWHVVKAYERSEAISNELADYRQTLRDITEEVGFPWEVEWPVKPQE